MERCSSLTRAGPQDTLTFVRAHVRALRAHAAYRDAELWLVPEANLGNDAQMISDHLIAAGTGICVVCQHDHVYGVFTTPTTPQAYAYRLQRKLDEDGVAFRADLVAANPWQATSTPEQRAAVAKRLLLSQLRRFQRTPIVPRSLMSRVRYAYSGVADNDGTRNAGKKHDVVMALLIGLYWSGQHLIGQTAQSRGATNRLVLPRAAS